MSPRAAALALCALVCTAGACGEKTVTATQVMVQVDAQTGVRSLTHDVLVHVRSGQGENSKWEDRFDKKMTLDTGRYRWPLQFALLPKNDDATRVYEITATALDDSGAEVARVRAISGYQPTKNLLLALTLDDACIGMVAECDDTESCRFGKCVDAQVDVGSLHPFISDDGNSMSLPGELDGGLDAASLPPSDGGQEVGDGATAGSGGRVSGRGGVDGGSTAGSGGRMPGTGGVDGSAGGDAASGDAGEQTIDAATGTMETCATNNGGCGDSQYYKCTDNVESTPSCSDIDECATNNGGCGNATYYKCTNNVGAARACADIDECATSNGGCGAKMCTNKIGAAPMCGHPKCTGIASCSVSPSHTCCVGAAITCGPNITSCSGGSLCDC